MLEQLNCDVSFVFCFCVFLLSRLSLSLSQTKETSGFLIQGIQYLTMLSKTKKLKLNFSFT